jgi:hypothetical protein
MRPETCYFRESDLGLGVMAKYNAGDKPAGSMATEYFLKT